MTKREDAWLDGGGAAPLIEFLVGGLAAEAELLRGNELGAVSRSREAVGSREGLATR